MCERRHTADGEVIVVGIGINVKNDVSEIEGATTLYAEYGKAPRLDKLFCRTAKELLKMIAKIERGSDIIDVYTRYAWLNGKTVRIVTNENEREALCLGIDARGLLLIREADGTVDRVAAADVSIRV